MALSGLADDFDNLHAPESYLITVVPCVEYFLRKFLEGGCLTVCYWQHSDYVVLRGGECQLDLDSRAFVAYAEVKNVQSGILGKVTTNTSLDVGARDSDVLVCHWSRFAGVRR